MRVLLLRHGMTEGNLRRRYIGKTDESLCPRGIEYARAAGGDPFLGLVYVTPLLRTKQTAEIMFENARQIVIDDLREMDFGDFENRSPDEMSDDKRYRDWIDGFCLSPCPNGESKPEFEKRVQDAFKKTILNHPFSQYNTAVFIVHGGVIMAVLEKYARPEIDFYSGFPKNCCGFICTVSPAESADNIPFVLTDAKRTEIPLNLN